MELTAAPVTPQQAQGQPPQQLLVGPLLQREQAQGPPLNPVEMGNTLEAMVRTLEGIEGYRTYFAEAFGTPGVTQDRVARALASTS